MSSNIYGLSCKLKTKYAQLGSLVARKGLYISEYFLCVKYTDKEMCRIRIELTTKKIINKVQETNDLEVKMFEILHKS